jgi:hypothetical protein
VERPDGVVFELADGVDDPAPHRGAVVVLRSCSAKSSSARAGAFLERFLAETLEH